MTDLLQSAFALARKEQDIAHVLTALIDCELYVAGKTLGTEWNFFSKSSPREGRICVTVTENPEVLSGRDLDLRHMTGLDLLNILPTGQEIVVCYHDGGDYITREQIEWFRSVLSEVGEG